MTNSSSAKVVYSISCVLIVCNIAFAYWYCSERRAWKYVDKTDAQAVKRYLDNAKGEDSRQIARHLLLQLLEAKYLCFDFNDPEIDKKLEGFMQRYPEFDTNRLEEDLVTASEHDIAKGKVYLRLFPQGRKAETVKYRIEELGSRIDQRNWAPISQSLDDVVLQNFAKKAQTQKYKKLAEDRISVLYADFEYVKSKDTCEAYRRYLGTNPNAWHAGEARKRLLAAARREGKKLSDQDIAPFQQSLPRSGLYRYDGRDSRIAPLRIITSRGDNYYVKAVPRGGGAPVCIFIRGGDTIDVDVPLGDYTIKYACGDKWYGEDLLFGNRTSYSKADSPFSFKRTYDGVSGYTLTLYKVQNGNLRTSTIDASSF